MGKYEVKVTSTSHMISMITTAAISLVVGVGVGYILGLTMPVSFNKQLIKPIVQAQTQKPGTKLLQKQTVQVNHPSKEEQTAYLEGVLNSFYDINLIIYNSIKSDSLNESKTKKVFQNSIFKDNLIKAYQGVLVKEQLQTTTDFVNNGNFKPNYYFDYFNKQEDSKVSSIENIEYKTNTISSKLIVANTFEYGGTYSIPSSQTFFGELKGKGVTSMQYSKLLEQKPSKVDLTETNEVTLIIQNIDGKWMITSMNDVLISSEISSATINGKKVTFADLLNKYIK